MPGTTNDCKMSGVDYGSIEAREGGKQEQKITIYFQGGVNHPSRVAITRMLAGEATVLHARLLKTGVKGIEMTVRTTPANIGLEVQRLIKLVSSKLQVFAPKVTPPRSRRGHRRNKTLASEPFTTSGYTWLDSRMG